HVRGPLSALPEEALFQVRLAAARGEEISPQLRQQLHDAAMRETPTGKVNLAKLDAAVDEEVKPPTKALRNASDDPRLRSELLAAVPTDLRVKMQDTPIVVMEGKDFEHFTGSRSGQAVTAIIEGQPVVVMRKGADARVLREEGVHALQAHDQRWQEHVGQLNEAKLRDWKQLPLEEQLKLYQTKVELEIDAQLQVKRSLEAELAGAGSKADRDALKMELARAEATLDNLSHRHDEVARVDPLKKQRVELGLLDRGKEMPFLDQAPRLFSKGQVPEGEGEPRAAGDPRAAPRRKVILEPFAGPEMDSPIDLLKRNPGAVIIATEVNNQPPPEQIAKLHAAGGVFVSENMGDRIPVSSVDEIKMRFPLPADAAPQQAWAAKMRDLRILHPGASDSELMVKELAHNDLGRRLDSLEAYAPYALQRLKPGGTMEVVFFEGHIEHEVHAARQLPPFRDPDGKLYVLELETLGQEPKRTVAPKSGWLVPLKGEDPLVNVARFRKVEVPEAATGARGPASGRDYDPEAAGGPVRHLDFSKVKFTTRAIDVVEAHVRRFEGGGGEAELAMVARLRQIAAGEIPATNYDRAFYTHELREFVRYRRLGWATGLPLDPDVAGDLWNNTHSATLEDYRIREKLPHGEWALFHPDIVVAHQMN